MTSQRLNQDMERTEREAPERIGDSLISRISKSGETFDNQILVQNVRKRVDFEANSKPRRRFVIVDFRLEQQTPIIDNQSICLSFHW